MITTSRLGLTVWNLGSDPYDHLELAANWQAIDDAILNRTGDTATGAMTIQRSAATDPGLHLKVAADSASRLKLQADGVYLGDGSGSYDIRLYRDGANLLKSNDQFATDYTGGPSFVSQASGTVGFEGLKGTSQAVIQNRLSALDSQPTFSILGSGEHKMGPGGSTAPDTRIYRSGSQTVTIESNLVVTNLEATNSITIGGVLLNVSGGAIQSNSSLITANIVRARDGQTGRTQIGDSGDPTRSIIYFGGGADVNLYRDGADRLRTDDALTIGQWLQVNSTASDSIETEGGIDVAGQAVIGGAVTISGATNLGTLLANGAISANNQSLLLNHLRGDNVRARSGIYLDSLTNASIFGLNVDNTTLAISRYTYTPTGTYSGRQTLVTFGQTIVNFGNLDLSNIRTLSLNSGGTVIAPFLQSNSIQNSGTTSTGSLTVTNSDVTLVTADAGIDFTQSLRIVSSGGGGVVARFWQPTPYNKIELFVTTYCPSFVQTSDEALKVAAKPVQVADKLLELETLGQWRFSKTAAKKAAIQLDTTQKHYGPTAQEFNEKFGLTPEPTDHHGINIGDMAGVALIGVRELAERVAQLEAQLSQEK